MGIFDDELIHAAKRGDTAEVALLLDRDADVHAGKDHALRWAAEHGHTATVELLLDRGADVHADDDYDGALRWAAGNGHTATVVLLLDRGADIHANDDLALRYAAEDGHTATAGVLLTHYALNASNSVTNKALIDDADVIEYVLKNIATISVSYEVLTKVFGREVITPSVMLDNDKQFLSTVTAYKSQSTN